MPDLPDDLRALLHERAAAAPPAPAPTEAYVRRVTRRRTARTGAALTAGALALTGLAVVGGSALQPRERAVGPAGPGGCAGPPSPELGIAVRLGERAFTQGCYVVDEDVRLIRFENREAPETVHLPALRSERLGSVVFHWRPNPGRNAETRGGPEPDPRLPYVQRIGPLRAGDYELFCEVHPDMRAKVVVRQASA